LNAEYPNSSVVLYYPPQGREKILDDKKKPVRVSQKPLDLLKELIVMYVACCCCVKNAIVLTTVNLATAHPKV